MADLTTERPDDRPADGATTAAAGTGAGAAAATATAGQPVPVGTVAGPASATDPRAVRVELAPATRLPDEPAVVVAPASVPVVPTRGSPAGDGPHDRAIADPAGSGGAVVADELQVRSAAPPTGPTALLDGEPLVVRLARLGPGRALLVEGTGATLVRHRVVFAGGPVTGPDGLVRREVVVDGWRFELELEPERRAALRERARSGRQAGTTGGPTEVHAIIPGRVVALSVEPGEAVTAGQQLLVVEAMKMQNELRSPREGTVTRIAVASGVNIEVGDLLLVIE